MDKMVEFLSRARRFFFAQKYRFDLGVSFISIVNFILLVLALGKDLLNELSGKIVVIAAFVAAVLLGVWLFGLFMDVVVKAPQQAERESIMRSETWQRHLKQMDDLNDKMDKILTLLGKRG